MININDMFEDEVREHLIETYNDLYKVLNGVHPRRDWTGVSNEEIEDALAEVERLLDEEDEAEIARLSYPEDGWVDESYETE